MSDRQSPATTAAESFGFVGELARLKLGDGPVSVAVCLDEEEHARRVAAQIGPITDRELLTALWELPHQISLDRRAIPGWALRRLAEADPSVAINKGETMWRSVRPPVVINGAIAAGRVLRRLLIRVGQLSAVAPMGIALQGTVDPADPALLDAALYGVGVLAKVGEDSVLVLEPEPIVTMPGPFLWWISELAYQQLTTTSNPDEPKPSVELSP